MADDGFVYFLDMCVYREAQMACQQFEVRTRGAHNAEEMNHLNTCHSNEENKQLSDILNNKYMKKIHGINIYIKKILRFDLEITKKKKNKKS